MLAIKNSVAYFTSRRFRETTESYFFCFRQMTPNYGLNYSFKNSEYQLRLNYQLLVAVKLPTTLPSKYNQKNAIYFLQKKCNSQDLHLFLELIKDFKNCEFVEAVISKNKSTLGKLANLLGTYEAALLTTQCDCTCDIYLKKKLKKVNKSDYE